MTVSLCAQQQKGRALKGIAAVKAECKNFRTMNANESVDN